MAPPLRIAALFSAATLLAGCRAVIGVEELVLSDGGPDTGADGAASVDAASDVASPDASSSVDGGVSVADCVKRCQDAGTTFYDEMHTCMCMGANLKTCASVCSGYCPKSVPPTSDCEACIATEALANGGTCISAATNCSQGCKAFVACVKACK